MKRFFIITAFILLIAGCDNLTKTQTGKPEPNNLKIPQGAYGAFDPSYEPQQVSVKSIKVVQSDDTPVEPDGTAGTAFQIKLKVGSNYRIKTEVSPDNADNKELSYYTEHYYKDYITTSEDGVISVRQQFGNNPITVSIRSQDGGAYANLNIVVIDDPQPIIEKWELTDVNNDYSTSNQIKISGETASKFDLKITKKGQNPYDFKYPDNVKIIEKPSSGTAVDEYEIIIKQNETVWEKKSFITCYQKANGTTKKEVLKTITVTQAPNFKFEKTVQWVKGVTPPAGLDKTPFKSSEWKEDNTTNWFGVCKRSYANGQDYPDRNLCWAMTSANMLHWWFTQNEANIEKYAQKKKIDLNGDMGRFYKSDYKKTNNEELKSNFANHLRLGFYDLGNPVVTGLKWYLEGRDSQIQSRKPQQLFMDVLNKGASIVETGGLYNKHDINKFKEAIKKDKVAAVTFEFGSSKYPRGHVVTVWGVSLDGEGNVFELWVADSDVSRTPNNAYIYNMGVGYGKNGHPIMVKLSGSNGIPEYTINKLSYITTLGLGRDKFTEFFNNNPD